MQEEIEYNLPLDEAIPDERWETAAEFTVTRALNNKFIKSLEDDNPWYTSASPYGAPLAHPGLLFQMAFITMIKRFPVAAPPGQGSRHAKQESEFFAPARVGEKVRIEVRLIDKYFTRGKDYIVHEARLFGEDNRPLIKSRHYRMIGVRE